MKIKEGWVLTELGGEYIAVPTQESSKDFCGIIRLNETGKDIWEGFVEGLSETEIALRLVETYDGVDQDRARKAVQDVAEKLKTEGVLFE